MHSLRLISVDLIGGLEEILRGDSRAPEGCGGYKTKLINNSSVALFSPYISNSDDLNSTLTAAVRFMLQLDGHRNIEVGNLLTTLHTSIYPFHAYLIRSLSLWV